MPRGKLLQENPPYQCPRCGYATKHKPTMRHHLYNTKKVCQGQLNPLTLTDDIKQHVMDNRHYIIPDVNKVTNQIINNYNNVNNFIAGMDIIEKLTKYTEYKRLEISDFENKVEDLYQRDVKRLENDSFKYGYSLDKQDLMKIVDTISQAIRGNQRDEFIEDINFIYDVKRKRIHVYSSDKWEEFLVQTGLRYLVETITMYYLESYEIYLIRKMQNCSVPEQAKYYGCLEDYYRFIACFDVDPFVKDKNDNNILFNKDHPTYDEKVDRNDVEKHLLVDRYKKMYSDIKLNLTTAQKKTMQTEVTDILKSNTKHNISELDKSIIGIIKIDDEFKNELLELQIDGRY